MTNKKFLNLRVWLVSCKLIVSSLGRAYTSGHKKQMVSVHGCFFLTLPRGFSFIYQHIIYQLPVTDTPSSLEINLFPPISEKNSMSKYALQSITPIFHTQGGEHCNLFNTYLSASCTLLSLDE